MHDGWKVCPELSLAEEAADNSSKWKEVLQCRKITVILVYEFLSEMIAPHFLHRP